MITYNKLVRDKIPEIILSQGKKCEVRVLETEDYLLGLKKKLQEELDEYGQSGEMSELADLLEVIYAIIDNQGISREKFEEIRLQKLEERGGFGKKLFLINVED